MKEQRKNETFSIKPSAKVLLVKLAEYYDRSQSRVVEKLIIEKAKKLKLVEGEK